MNLFDAQLWIIARINSQVTGLTTVGNPGLIAGLKDLGPLLPCAIVQPGGGEIMNKERNAIGAVEDQLWQVTVIVGYEFNAASYGNTESVAGTIMAAIIDALSGQHPGAGFYRMMMYDGREDPVYSLGYAEFPMTFHVKKIVGNAALLTT